MKVVYALRDDADAVHKMQSESQPGRPGSKGPDDLIGTEQWWAKVDGGQLVTHLEEGVICGFWPGDEDDHGHEAHEAHHPPAQFQLWPARGPRTLWPCGLAAKAAKGEFRIGRTVALRYVNHRLPEVGETKVVLSIALE